MARPTKLTPRAHKAIVEAIAIGATYAAAAGAAGVEYETLNNWMIRGGRGGESPEEAPFVKFFNAVRQAEAECEVKYTKIIFDKSKRDWRAALEWLKRRRRAAWGDTPLPYDVDLNLFTKEELEQITSADADPVALALKGFEAARQKQKTTQD